ncbi:hypothetical protein [Streptomyces sp. ME18-1-4]|uniref:hypothetical protein n=1 Tax=Streptomyces sp. ME18-1-4 TaxID=3028685 RepID=UPI0029B0FC32|nr:hypothetical protein [Streptomyces sp. ME18-1-4]MDX3243793.1 hypothetical protein [Streptomyces sp. ME18-1-4]
MPEPGRGKQRPRRTGPCSTSCVCPTDISDGWRPVTALFLALALLYGPFPSTAHAAIPATAITVDGTSGGRTFDGVGAISGGGNTRLLALHTDGLVEAADRGIEVRLLRRSARPSTIWSPGPTASRSTSAHR